MSRGKKKPNVGNINPEKGKRGDFMQITTMINPELFEAVKMLEAKRRAKGEKGVNFSSITRQALAEYLKKEGL